MDHVPNAATPRTEERGIALILGLMFTMIVAGICLTGTTLLRSHIQKNRTSWASKSQALQVARSGLAEAHSWLRRQTSQPVTAFAPLLNTTSSPQVLDTIDPNIGLVREFRVTEKIFARYEVWKRWDTDPDSERRAWRQQFECEDVSSLRGAPASGTIWRLRSVGYIFEQFDPNVPFDQAPNKVIASQVASNEYRRLVLTLPGNAAINVGDGNSCHINTNGRIIGGSAAGIFYPAGTGTPTTGPNNAQRVTGTPRLATTNNYDDSYETVFGMSYEQLRAMATLVITDTNSIPSPMPEHGIVVIETNNTVSFDASRPLRGTALVIVKRNTTIQQGSNSDFNGMLYVDGNLTVRETSTIRGAVVCTGNVTVQGSGAGQYATIQYDGNVLNQLLGIIGNYAMANATLLPRTAH
ncbi:MAG: hypothetical protein FJ301_04355 [Planctomycetes bacterium]|nr:hypothetical protein [Planctomycetota bacterium]